MTTLGPNVGVTTPSYVGIPGAGGGPPPPPALWNLLAKSAAFGTTSAIGVTPAINTTGADLIVLGVSSVGVATVNDSAGNTWATANTGPGGTNRVSIFYCSGPVTSTAHTFQVTTPTNSSIAVLAYSGSRATPVDVTNSAITTTGWTTSQPGSITPTAPDDLLVNAVSLYTIATTLAVDSGFTVQELVDSTAVGGERNGVGLSSFVQGNAAAINPTATRGTAEGATISNRNAVASFFQAPPAPAAAWQFVGKASVQTTGPTAAINTTGADLLVAVCISTATGAITPSDSASNTWTQAVSQTSWGNLTIFYVHAPTTSAAHTFNFTPNFGAMTVLAYAGSRATPLDQHTGANFGPGVTTGQPGSITPTAANELIVNAISIASAATTLTVSAPFTMQAFIDNNANPTGIGVATYVQPTAAAVNPTMTRGATNSPADMNAIASFFHA